MSNLNADELERLTEVYCRRAAEEWAYLRENGAEIPLTDVYVMLEAAEEARREALDESSDLVPLEERLERAGVPARAKPRVKPPAPPMPLEVVLRESRRLVMLGEPGSGKSTTLQYIGLCYARRSALTSLHLNEEHVPVLTPLGAYAEKIKKVGLMNVLGETVGDFLPLDEKHEAEELLRAWNREGRLLVLLDGLDEVPEGLRSTVSGKIRSLQGALMEINRITVASRRANYAMIGSPFKEFNLKPLEAKEVRLFLARWLEVLRSEWDEGRANSEAGNLLRQMSDRPALRRMTDNPQILKLAARNYAESGGKLAANRSELYERYVQSAYASRDAPFGLSRLKEVLEDLAWSMHVEQMPEISKEEIELVRHNTGLIARIGERLTFAHFTLQEYFVARRLAVSWAKNPDWTWRFLKPRLHLPEWHEPMLLLAGTMKEGAAKDLVRRVLGARSTAEGLLPRDLGMAAEMTAENQVIAARIAVQAGRKRLGWHLWDRSIGNIALVSTFGQLGEAALPALRAALKNRDRNVRSAAASALGQTGEAALSALREALKDPDEYVRSAAAGALGKMGKAALPDLWKALKDRGWFVRSAAAGALGQMDEVAGPDLREALKDPDEYVRSAAASALGHVGEAALPALREALKDRERHVRSAVASALGHVGEAALPALREALKDPDEYVRSAAAGALGHVGEAALPELREALKDRGWIVRHAAVSVLVQMDKAALPALRDSLKDPDGSVRNIAIGALVQMDEVALPELREALKDPDRNVRHTAVSALGQMGEGALPGLREALKDPDGSVRNTAASALGYMGKAALPDLQEALRIADESVRAGAVSALGHMGEAALPALQEALGDPHWNVRKAAVSALGQMGEEALPALRKALKDPDGIVRQAAVRALGQVGEAAPLELWEELRDPDIYVREATMRALGQVGKADAPELREALEHADRELRRAGTSAIIMMLIRAFYALPHVELPLMARSSERLMLLRQRTNPENLRMILQARERIWIRLDPYLDPRLPPPRSRLERTASFAGFFLTLVVLLSLAGILAVLSGSAGKVLGDQVTEAIRKVAVDHPIWMLVFVVGLLAAAAGLLNFFLLDRIKVLLRQWLAKGGGPSD